MNYLKKIYHRVNLFYIIVLFLISFSCENNLILHIENDNQNTVITTKPSGKYIDITGRFTTQEEKSSGVRNAIPTPGSNKNTIRYYAKAIPEEEGVEVVFGTVNVENKTFTITGIKLGITWTVEVGMEVRISAPDEREIWARAFYDVSESKKFTETDYVINKNFILQPDTSKTGSIDLDMILDSSIATVSISLSDENQKAKWEAALAKDANHIISTSKIKVSNIPSGSYELNISFYNVNGSYPVYTTTQTINVISGMVTDTWCSNGSALISSAGEFKLTSDIITSYIDSCIYVGQNAAATSIGVHASNLNEGRAYSPLATFSEAVNRITNFGAKKDYKIFISGNIQEFAALSLQKEKASSITIRGLNGLDENNFPKDSIDGGNKSSALSINAEAIPVNIINLQITGGNSSCLGIGSSSTVSLNGGVVIGNTTAEPETRTNVGIVNTGSLTINGAKILGNKTGISSYGENSCLEIAGATISNNSVAGITIGNDDETPVTFKISGNVNMPYVPDDTETTENNIIDLRGGSFITVCGAISCDKPIVFSTSGTTLARGNPVVQADNVNIKDLTPYKDCFVPLQQGWNLRLSSDKKALSFDYPFYVAGRETYHTCQTAGSDDSSADGSISAPFATIKKAIELINSMNDSNQNYTILIDGEILSTWYYDSTRSENISIGQDIGGEIKARSLTITGANALVNNQPVDIISGYVDAEHNPARALTITTTVPVSLEKLKITNGLADLGGGIYYIGGSEGSLTLGNDVLITLNNANNTGGGVYCKGNLNVKGNVDISFNGETNLYLVDGKRINVTNALKNGDKNARIGVSIENDPNPSAPVQITNNYSNYSSGQSPDTYFFGDKWNITQGGAGEVYLASTGGGISVAPNYENITIGINQTIASASAATKEFTFIATAEDDEGNTVDVEIGSGEGKVSITDMIVTYHGETVPESYYTKGTSSITFGNSLPEGHYTITLSAVYNGRNYSAEFGVNIL